MIGRPSHLLLSVVAGDAREKTLGLEWGRFRRPFSVGKGADWAVCAPGVADVHLHLAVRGSRLYVAPASAETRVRSGGVRLPETWSELPLPAELRFGQARIRASAALSSPETLAATRAVDRKKLAPLLDASRPGAARLPAALRQTALASPPSPLLETVCDGGALRREAERLRAEAQAGAGAQRPEPAAPALDAPAPAAFRQRPMPAAAARRALRLRWVASTLSRLSERCRGLGARRWQQLRTLRVWPSLSTGASTPGLRRAAIASLALLLLVMLAALHRRPSAATAPLGSNATSSTSSATEPSPSPHLVAAHARGPAPEATITPGAPTLEEEAEEAAVSGEPPPPSPELQREAFRAALGGDNAAAAALYQQLAHGPNARVYQLAARYATQGRVRRP